MCLARKTSTAGHEGNDLQKRHIDKQYGCPRLNNMGRVELLYCLYHSYQPSGIQHTSGMLSLLLAFSMFRQSMQLTHPGLKEQCPLVLSKENCKHAVYRLCNAHVTQGRGNTNNGSVISRKCQNLGGLFLP